MHTSCYNDPCASSGFSPVSTPWNPAFAPDGPEMTLSNLIVSSATYFVAGKIVWINLWASFTLELVAPAVTGVPYITFTLPYPPKTLYSFGGACTINAGAGFEAGPWFTDATSSIRVRVGAGGPNFWTAGNFRTIIGNEFYEML